MLTHRARSILGDIPDDWQVKPVRKLTVGQFSGDWGNDDGEQAVAVIRSTNFTNHGQLDLSDVATRYFPRQKADSFVLQCDDLLVERSGGGPDQPVGRVGFITDDMPGTIVSNFVQVLRPDPDKVNPKFLGWVLYELQRTGVIERVQQQSTQMRNLNWRDYQRLLLPWPKLDEQHRIATALNLADEAIVKARKALEATKVIKRSLITDLLLDVDHVNGKHALKLGSLPNGWHLHRFSRFVTFRQLGTNEVADHGVLHTPILKMADIGFGELDLHAIEHVGAHKSAGLSAFLLQDGDFLFNTRNTADLVGKSAVWRGELPTCIFNNNILRLRFNPEVVLPEYLNLELASWRGRRRNLALATGTTSVAAIYWQDLGRTLIPLPSVEYQQEVVDKVHAANGAVATIQSRLEALEIVKLSLLQNLLTGKIRLPQGAFHA